MQKKYQCLKKRGLLILIEKIPNAMKLSFLFMLISFMSFTAKATAQKVSVTFNNVKMEKILSVITKQTGLNVAYSKQVVNLDHRVSIHVKDAEVNHVLDLLVAETNMGYEVKNGKIYLFDKKNERAIQQQEKRKITGVVKDKQGEIIIGANVVVKGTTIGNITDMNGKFSLEVPENATLQISYIGYKPTELPVGKQTFLNILLTEDTEMLEEVVVVGYGTTKRRDVVGSISKISSEDIVKIPSTNLAESLQGMSSGMMVTNNSGHPGSAPQIKIRGLNSINLSTDPLWIIDGMPIHTGSSEHTQNGVKGVSPISMINPNDIESIEVLKDAAATAIYGSRAAGGVILVTTKSNKGKLTGVKLSYDGGVSRIPFSQNDIFVDSPTWWQMMDKAQANAGNVPTDPTQIMATQFWGERPDMTREEAIATNTDHLKALTQDAYFHQFGLTANKGFETGGVMFSANYRDEKGLIKNNDFKRFTGRFSFNFKPLNSVEMGVNANFIYLKTNGVKSSQGKGNGGWANWRYTLPWYKVYDENSQTGYWAVNSGYNMAAFSDRDLTRNDVDQYRTLGNAYLQWNTPLKGLMVKGEAGVDLIVNNSTFWQSSLLAPTAPFVSRAFEQSVTKSNINYDAYANYNRTFNEIHFLDVTVGAEASRNWSYTRYAEGQDLQTVYPELINPLTMNSMGGHRGGDAYLMGLFARANYKLLDRYLLNASVRRDGHSAFSKDNRWANFYAFGAGWIMTEEGFMKDLEWLNMLKLRGSCGITGNTAVSNSMTYLSWGLDTNKVFGVDYLHGATTVGPMGSKDLKWETTANLDLGFDFGILNNRINGSFAYYTQKVSDLILLGNVQPSVGFDKNQIYENVGDLKNWGFEFNVSSVNIENRNFTWKTDFNISTNKNKILTLNAAEQGKGKEESTSIRKEGEALNTYYLANNVGVDSEKGIYMIEQRDKDAWDNTYETTSTGKIIPMTNNNVSNNKMIQHGKTPLPKFYGGLSNTFYYRNFDLNVMFSFAGGHWLMNSLYTVGTQLTSESNTVKDMVGNIWEKAGDNAKYPQLVSGNNYHYDNDGNYSEKTVAYGSVGQTTRFLQRGDYIRLRNLQLGYTLPKSALNAIRLSNVRFYVGVTNLFTITGYDGLDPETQQDLPIPRTVNFGLSLNL